MGAKMTAAVLLAAAAVYVFYVGFMEQDAIVRPKGSGSISHDAKNAMMAMALVSLVIGGPTLLNHIAAVIPGKLAGFLRVVAALLSVVAVALAAGSLVSDRVQNFIYGESDTSDSARAVQSMAGVMVLAHSLPKLIAHSFWFL